MVWHRYRAERLANQERCHQLFASRQNGNGTAAEAATLTSLSHNRHDKRQLGAPKPVMLIKPPGPKIPWLAYAALYRDPLGYLTRVARKYGDIVHIKIGRKSDFLLNHPDLVRAALLDHENLRRCVHRPLRRVHGNGFATCRGAARQERRAR